MHVATCNAHRCQALRTAIGLQQQVNHLIGYQVTTFEQDRLGAHGQQFFRGRGQGVSSDQTFTAGGHHHEVKRQAGESILVNGPSHDLDNFRCMQHPDIYGVNADDFNHRLDLRLQKLGGYSMESSRREACLRAYRCGLEARRPVIQNWTY
jgi:hypothetical protein